MKVLWCAALCLMLPTTLLAQEKRSLALLPVQGVGVDNATPEIFTELLTAELGRIENRRVITMRDIEAMLGFEQTRQAFDCSEMSCLAEIGGTIGVDELLYPRVTGLGDDLMISLTLLDVRKAEVVGRISTNLKKDPNEYRRGAKQALEALWVKVRSKTSYTDIAPRAAPIQVLKSDATQSSFSGPSTWSWVMMGTGAALLGTATYFGLEAKSQYDLSISRNAGAQRAIGDGKTASMLTNIFLVTGVAAAATGISLWFFSDDESSASPTEMGRNLSLTPYAYAGDTGLLLQGSF
ncbi:MAG: hypothetical protein HOK97_09780 [Deltaproteobacteria bacterium]|nr:hypothetical protein [Deltaproteobacteria bacterium]MBT6490040.1 hypothetical protein [Deltaproteobacteria bacterium]